MKICSKCGTEKPDSEFNKRSATKAGLQSYCKECSNNFYKSWKESGALVDRKEAIQKRDLARRKKNLDKWAAHAKVRAAIDSGTLTKMACEVCGNVKAVAHHDDYSKPLDVRWLCHSHHALHHYTNKQSQPRPLHTQP